jgi:hypothetical protein
MLYDLKSKLSKDVVRFKIEVEQTKKPVSVSATTERENLTASYEVCLESVKHKKSFRDGELIKRCAIKMANAFSDS